MKIREVLGFILVIIILGIEIYSIRAAFDGYWLDSLNSDGNEFDAFLGIALRLFIGVFSPLWIATSFIVALFGALVCLAGLVMVIRRVFLRDDDSSIALGAALFIGGYLYTTKVSTLIMQNVVGPTIYNFINSVLVFLG